MEMNFGRLIQIQIQIEIEVKVHFTSLHFVYSRTIQDQRLFYFYHDQGGNSNRDFNQEPSKCLLALFSLKIGKSTTNTIYTEDTTIRAAVPVRPALFVPQTLKLSLKDNEKDTNIYVTYNTFNDIHLQYCNSNIFRTTQIGANYMKKTFCHGRNEFLTSIGMSGI